MITRSNVLNFWHQLESSSKNVLSYLVKPIGVLGFSAVLFTPSCLAQEPIIQGNTGVNMTKPPKPDLHQFDTHTSEPYIHIAELEITPEQIDNFKPVGIESINNTLDQEDGVLEFHAIIKRGTPDKIFVFESYKNKKAYEIHIQSTYYKEFLAKTENWIRNKAIHEALPVILARKPTLSSKPFVRIAEIEIYHDQLDSYKTAVKEEIQSSISLEPDVLAIYSIGLNDHPSHLRFLEFYASEQAYLQHIESPHFQHYKKVTSSMIKSLKLFDAEPIKIGLKKEYPTPTPLTNTDIMNINLPKDVDIKKVAPALEHYTREKLYGDVWKRPNLSLRDRSIVTISTMIARGQVEILPNYLAQALDNGVKPSEISEIIVHLAYYSGWGNALAAINPAKTLFDSRGIGPDQLPAVNVDLLPLNEEAEAQRAASVAANYGAIAPGVVQFTTEALFLDLWRRPDLAPRDRSLVTVSALIANGHASSIGYHLNRAMDNGLTREQASEVLTQLAFYAGWPNVFSALPAVKEVFEARSRTSAKSSK